MTNVSIKREQLTHFLNETLKPHEFQDYGPNGLQIEGKEEISRIAFSVSATQESINESIKNSADALIVHHGLFWSFHGVRTLTGPFAKRVLPITRHHINLYGYHLPLDAHPEIGNAASLANLIGLSIDGPFGDYKGSPTGIKGHFSQPLMVSELKAKCEKILEHNVILSSPNLKAKISNMGIITGGANGGWFDAFQEGLDSYLTGEISEHDWHDAKEAGVHMLAGGHNATEKFGIQSLMRKVKNKFNVECIFIDSLNPA